MVRGCDYVASAHTTPVCTQYYQFLLAQGVLFGIGSTLLFHPSVAAPGQWFARRRALAMGCASLGSGLGGVVWPILVRRLVVQIGFAWTMRALGFISLAVCAGACVCVRTRLPRKTPVPWSTVLAPMGEAPFALLTVGTCLVMWG